jgi:2-polyprenyl-3-methyl-5-hydroxy-6-metoxy-1,4-benzoquinol methylase
VLPGYGQAPALAGVPNWHKRFSLRGKCAAGEEARFLSGQDGSARFRRRRPKTGSETQRIFMRKPQPQPGWPESWHNAFRFDLLEFFGESRRAPGYVCAYHTRFQKLIDMVETRLPKGSAIIDVAAAQGNFSLALAERGYRVTWNDLAGDLANYVKLKHASGEISFIEGNAFDLTVGGFDGAVITEVIEHVAHPDQFLRQVAGLVRPGGYVFMTTPNGEYLRNRLPRFSDCPDPSIYEAHQFKPDADGHIFLLHLDELARLAAPAGLEILHVDLFTNPLTTGHMKLSLLHHVLPKSFIAALESWSQSKLPPALARRVLTQMGVCFRKIGDASEIPAGGRALARHEKELEAV